jgi:hypothetical protein
MRKMLALFITQDYALVGAFSILGQAKYAVNAINFFTEAWAMKHQIMPFEPDTDIYWQNSRLGWRDEPRDAVGT